MIFKKNGVGFDAFDLLEECVQDPNRKILVTVQRDQKYGYGF